MNITYSNLDMIQKYAEKYFPLEVCGALIGKVNSISRIVPLENISKNPSRTYTIDPIDLMRLEDELKDNEEIIGFYHSHPNNKPTPSKTDIKYSWPEMIYMIVALQDGSVTQIRCWKIEERNIKSIDLMVE